MIPLSYSHYSYCDYHQSVDWAIGYMSLSPFDELFIWGELDISPKDYKTSEIALEMAKMRGHYKFTLDVIDPLSSIVNNNTSTNTIQDLNKCFIELQKQGICEHAYFVPADTKGEVGILKLRERIKNSNIVKTPFNNQVIEMGIKKNLPTVWIFNNCVKIQNSIRNWRLKKGVPGRGEYSHHCRGIEYILKDSLFRPPSILFKKPIKREPIRYFQTQR